MPKMKTNKSASKRFRVTKTGKIVFVHSGLRHNLESKTGKRKRSLGRAGSLAASAHEGVLRRLGRR